jgi:TonB-dependent receptor
MRIFIGDWPGKSNTKHTHLPVHFRPFSTKTSIMQSSNPSLLAAVFFMIAASAFGQSAGTGSVTGRVFNPAAEEYVRNAQIRVVGDGAVAGEAAISGEGGFYLLTRLPVGEVTLELSYTGHPNVTATATVAAGATVTVDFDLPAPAVTGPTVPAATGTTGSGVAGEIVQLERFTVTGEVAGQAKAIMQQRASMDIIHTIASDVFGDDPTGNVGEFLRNIPGVTLERAGAEVRRVGLGGLDPEYTNITIDGVSLSVANAENATRAPTFELVSLSGIESLDISRTVSADVDANAPAGTINLRTKSAFDRRGTHVTVRAYASMHSTAMTLDKTLGPDDDRGVLKIRPGYNVEFTTAVKNKFGLIANVTETNVYSETYNLTVNYDRNPSAADPRPQLPSSIVFQQQPTINRRFSASVRADWRISPRLWIGADVLFNHSSQWIKQRSVTFNTGILNPNATTTADTRRGDSATILTGDHLEYAFETTNGSLSVYSPSTVKLGQYLKPTFRFEYKARDLVIDGNITYGDSKSWYDSLNRKHTAYIVNLPSQNVNFRANRSTGGMGATDYRITILPNPANPNLSSNLSTGTAFGNSSLFPKDDRGATARALNAQLNVSFITRWLWPVNWKTGFKTREEKRTFDRDFYLDRVRYEGASNWSGFKSGLDFASGSLGTDIILPDGGTLFFPDNAAIARRYLEHPDEFRSLADDPVYYQDYYNAKVYYNRNYHERIDAGYFMGTTTFWGKRLQARAGLRWEKTLNDVTEPTPLTVNEVAAAGFSVNTTTGLATSPEGIDYQFFTNPRTLRKKDYAYFFPSAAFKYIIRANLAFQFGMSSTIRRPTYEDFMGANLINEATRKISIPNIYLEPERARNFAARLFWYFKGTSNLSAAVYQNYVKNMIQSDEIPVANYDSDLAAQYPDYMVTSRFNGNGTTRVRSLELGGSQKLGFLGPALKGLSVRANYTRSIATETKSNLVPKSINAGLNYGYRSVNLYANYNWTGTTPVTASGWTIRHSRSQTTLGGHWRINRRYTVAFHISNLFNDKYKTMQRVPPSELTLITCEEVGTFVNLTLKAEW